MTARPRIVFFLAALLVACLFANWTEDRYVEAVTAEISAISQPQRPGTYGMSSAGMSAMSLELFRSGILSQDQYGASATGSQDSSNSSELATREDPLRGLGASQSSAGSLGAGSSRGSSTLDMGSRLGDSTSTSTSSSSDLGSTSTSPYIP